jgi:hypothetical protein
LVLHRHFEQRHLPGVVRVVLSQSMQKKGAIVARFGTEALKSASLRVFRVAISSDCD